MGLTAVCSNRSRGKVKRPGHKVTLSSSCSDEVKMSGALYLLSLSAYFHGVNNETFTFSYS